MDHTAYNKTLYACPMDPDVIKEKAGKCPKCGMELTPLEPYEKKHGEHTGHMSMEDDFKKRFFITLPLVLIIMLLSPNIQKWFGFSLDFFGKNFLMFVIGTFIFFIGGKPFFKAAKGEISTFNLGMMTLVALAISVGYFFSVAATFLFAGESLYWEISTLISVFLLGHWFEMRAVRGATGALNELAKLIPPTAHKIVRGPAARVTPQFNIIDVKTEELEKGDRVLVKPGEKIPIDGIVVDGESFINESMVTGESRPISKKKADKVIGGTINNDGSLTIEITKVGRETAVAQIMDLIRKAQESKPNVQHLADRAANVLTFVAIIAGISSFLFWFFVSPHGAVFAATLAVSAIVVACPHALGLAIPTVTTVTSALGARNGILIKDMKGLEIARKINYVVFDKTGTLTKGEFGVVNVVVAGSTFAKASADKPAAENEILRLAAAVEAHSQHSIAAGIVNEAKKRDIKAPEVKGFKSYPGKGAEGMVEGKRVAVGNKALMDESKVQSLGFEISDEEAKGKTQVYVVVDNRLAGVILLADMVREESKEAIAKLKQMGIKTAMLTGDTKDVAEKIGKQLDIDTIFAQVLPDDKVNKVKELQSKGNIVAMVGDGVNDAPSLTQAHVGIAIGAGTDVAVESAEIVLMKNDPEDVVKAISLSRKTNTKMVQNLIWATGYNVLAIPTAAGVFYKSFGILLKPEWAAILMSLSSIIVVFNALLLKKAKLD